MSASNNLPRQWRDEIEDSHSGMKMLAACLWWFIVLTFAVAVCLFGGCTTRNYHVQIYQPAGAISVELLLERTTSASAAVPVSAVP